VDGRAFPLGSAAYCDGRPRPGRAAVPAPPGPPI